jgi:signal transduction histidine kinase
MSVRTRLTLVYGALFLVSGIALLGVNYLLVDRATANETVTLVRPDGSSVSAIVGTSPGSRPEPAGEDGTSGAEPAGIPDPATMRRLAEEQHAAHMQALLVQSGIALLIMTVASVVLGWIVAHRALRPLRIITATTRRITSHNLGERLALDGPADEVKELADTVDDLLARLDSAFQAQRRFVANASHELRTPLARQRTIAQVALDDPDATADELRAAHERVLASGAQQERLIDTLLTLARGQNGGAGQEEFDLAAVARDAVAASADDARDAGVSVEPGLGGAAVRGDAKLVERMVVNLLDNAIRHNRRGGTVRVVTETRDGHPVLAVENTGPEIPPGEVDRLFEPFHRLDAGRTGAGREGHGLGLSIVRAVADAHGAAVEAVAPPAGGLAIEVRFP